LKHIDMKPSTVRMLLPGLGKPAPQDAQPWTPQSIRAARLRQAPGGGAPSAPMPQIIVGRMAKGGVGKTTVIGNLGSALAMMGHKVLLVDGDPQASLTGLMGVDWTKEGLVHIGHLMRRCYQRQPAGLEAAVEPIYPAGHLDLIPADITLVEADSWMMGAVNREQLFVRLLNENAAFFSRYEAILVDTAPATSLLTNALMLATREILAVAMLDGSSVKAMQVLASNIAEINAAFPGLNMGVHIVANGYHGSYKSCGESLQAIASLYPGQANDTVLPWSAAFRRQVSPLADGPSGTVLEREPQSDSAAAMAELARSLAERYRILLDGRFVSPSADGGARGAA
jgi:chromosome partitioning protein